MKYVFVTGGPMSGIGKGIIASSIAMMLGWNNIPTTAIKIDGYLNYDADTMSPYEHGEAYVTADGGVSDLDLGNYERFVGLELSRNNSITMGKIYAEVTRRERAGEYGGKTVQIVPHVTDAIKDWIRRVANSPAIINDQQVQPQVCIVEIGGTVGDMETLPVFHAIKQMIYEGLSTSTFSASQKKSAEAFCFVHVSHLSYVGSSDGDREEKTKPTQHNIELLRSLGISPNLMVIRCEKQLSDEARAKLAAQCLVPHIIDSYNVSNIHCVPEVLYQQNIIQIISQVLGLGINVLPIPDSYAKLIAYFQHLQLIKDFHIPIIQPQLRLAIVGKYTGMNDTYLSLIRAIQHAAFAHDVNVIPEWIDAEELYYFGLDKKLDKFHGILVPGGFGSRGISGMLKASRYARRTNKPYFGICLGMQIMVSELALEIFEGSDVVCAHSSEWCNCNKKHVIQLLPGQEGQQSGATMRLGNFSCHIENGTIAHQCYKTSDIVERHRHRYEVNNELVGHLEDNGLIFSGTHISDNYGTLCEIAEFSDKKFHVGCQFHPEFLSRHWKSHPLFYGFISAMKSEISN